MSVARLSVKAWHRFTENNFFLLLKQIFCEYEVIGPVSFASRSTYNLVIDMGIYTYDIYFTEMNSNYGSHE
jgi:hypothetical protein